MKFHLSCVTYQVAYTPVGKHATFAERTNTLLYTSSEGI